MMKLVGYTYEADIHCVECSNKAFPELAQTTQGTIEAPTVYDQEGNEPGAVFDDTEWSYATYCSDCGEPIDTVNLQEIDDD